MSVSTLNTDIATHALFFNEFNPGISWEHYEISELRIPYSFFTAGRFSSQYVNHPFNCYFLIH